MPYRKKFVAINSDRVDRIVQILEEELLEVELEHLDGLKAVGQLDNHKEGSLSDSPVVFHHESSDVDLADNAEELLAHAEAACLEGLNQLDFYFIIIF